MGVNLRDLFPQHPVPEGWFLGKRIAVDGHNVAFRYLTSFRGRDGDLLRSPDGRAIGHMLGYVNLVRHLRERGAEPIVVWDGQVHPRKWATVEGRINTRLRNVQTVDTIELELATGKRLGLAAFGAAWRRELAARITLLEGLAAEPGATPEDALELDAARAEAARASMQPDAELGAARIIHLEREVVEARRRVTQLDRRMISDCSRLLEALGVAVVKADHDGERYASALCHAGHADAVATEDFDALVAGAPAVLRKLGSAQPFMHRLADLDAHRLDRQQLRHIAILCGTDWNYGVRGFGAKTAVKALREQPDMRKWIEEAQAGGTGRYHKLLRDAGMTLAAFDELDQFIAQMPTPTAPRAAQPDPGMAVAVAEEMGIARGRVLACFC
ncbi:MAG TPA: hypothetical protein VM286_09410 [Candidatus Thermoplasmatota archaeon]|nr:hypothetical protein [Candidatus Thermoplasmatota archaeon]